MGLGPRLILELKTIAAPAVANVVDREALIQVQRRNGWRGSSSAARRSSSVLQKTFRGRPRPAAAAAGGRLQVGEFHQAGSG